MICVDNKADWPLKGDEKMTGGGGALTSSTSQVAKTEGKSLTEEVWITKSKRQTSDRQRTDSHVLNPNGPLTGSVVAQES